MSGPLYHEIEQGESNLETLKHDYLRRWGWKLTCSTPGSYWLWRRDFRKEDAAARRRWRERKPGPYGKPSPPSAFGVITASDDTAIAMTLRSLDERPEIGGDEED